MAMSEQNVVSGHIDAGKIEETYHAVHNLVETFNKNLHPRMIGTTAIVKDNWVGKGRNEFESQYKLVISKFDDLGDVLAQIYNELVDAKAEYDTEDNKIKQDFNGQTQEMRGN